MDVNSENPVSYSPAHYLRLWARCAPPFLIGVGLLVWFRWIFFLQPLSNFAGDIIAINPYTALGFVFLGIAYLSSFQSKTSYFSALLVIALGVIKFISHAYSSQEVGDEILVHLALFHPSAVAITPMATNTALNLILLGFAILLSQTETLWIRILWQGLVVFVAFSALVSLMGYVYGARSSMDFGAFTPMPLLTTLVFLVASTGFLCAHPQKTLVKNLAVTGTVGITARRLSMGAILVPLILGWLTLSAERANLFQPLFGLAFFAVWTMVGFLTLILINGATLSRLEFERARILAEIRESEERFRLLSESSFEAIMISVDGAIQDVNERFCEMFGYEREEALGMPLLKIAAPEKRELLKNRVENQIENLYRSIAQRKDGSQFEVEVWARTIPFHGANARVSAVRDITEQKEVERLKDEFVSVVSHELRTPLTAIHGSLGLLDGGVVGKLPEKAGAMVSIARRNSERLLALINDILDVQKAESDRTPFQKTAVDLRALAKNALEINEAYAREWDVEIQLLDGPSVEVRGDSHRLTQVFSNLLSNAAKFSPSQSTIEIAVLPLDNGARVEIRDRGTGIPLEFRPRMFQKFVQADSSATRALGGTGLGLSICKAIIERSGGQIGFQDREGGGTIFWFELPN